MRKEFVTFFSPGTLFSENTEKEIPSRDIRLAMEMAKTITERYNAKPYGFRFETRIVHDPIPDGEGGMLTVNDKLVDRSGVYYFTTKMETLEEVKLRNDPKEEILRSNMLLNWPIVAVIEHPYKLVQPFQEKDFLLNTEGEIVCRGDLPMFVEYRKSVFDSWR